ncbi:MAG: hypothetical protein AAF458_02525 [Pseudomonadota bacterium]
MSSVDFSGRFVVFGYGSLIWDLDDLAPHVELPWEMDTGPALPMEFSRVSPKRKLGLVAVLDADHGDPCPTHAIASVRNSIDAAAEDLKRRERASSVAKIGAVCMRTGLRRSFAAAVAKEVETWCRARNAAGAVWADLAPNFAEVTGHAFSVERACDYLKSLTGENRAEAVRYLHFAPPATDTPLRRRLAQELWWCEAVREVVGSG